MSAVIIIPTLKERENLEKLIPAVFEAVPDVSILVVDDISRDGTFELIESLKAKYPKLQLLTRTHDRGYGHSILDGLRWAREHGYEQAVTMDADFSHDFKQIPAMRGYHQDFVVGSRYVPGGGIENWSWYRRLLSLFSNYYVRIILNVPIHDMTTGFMLYNKSAIDKLVTSAPASEGYAFLVAGKYALLQSGLTMVEHPFIYPERREGQSKMSWRVIWESVLMPWRLRFGKK